jgi:hypothetical protein
MAKPVAQVFLSYAHLDNNRPHGFEMGWVDRLYDALDVELPTHGLAVRWWRDKRDLEPESYFDETILNAISNSDAFLAILSPVYPQRAFCVKELKHFLDERGADETGRRRRRVLKVLKRPIVDPDISQILPEEIHRSLGFPFYAEDRQTKRVHLFVRNNGEIARPAEFWDAIEDLAAAIARSVHDTVKPRQLRSQSNLAIYVAEPSDDQRQNYRTIRSELTADGFQVLPDQDIPDDHLEAVTFIDEHLSRSAMSIHLLGERAGFIPSARAAESSKPITQLQLDRAEARYSADPSFRRFIWASQQPDPGQDDQQNLLLSAFKDGSALRESDEFVTEPLELFKNIILDWWQTRRTPTRNSVKHPCPTLLITHPSDKKLGEEFSAALHAAQYEVFSLSFEALEDERRLERLIAQVDAAIVLFSQADETWAQTVLGALFRLSALQDNRRLAIRATLFSEAEQELSGRFRSHYCNLVLTGTSRSWDGAVEALQAELDRARSP